MRLIGFGILLSFSSPLQTSQPRQKTGVFREAALRNPSSSYNTHGGEG